MRWVADTDDSDAGIRLGAGGASAVACAAGAEGSSLRAALCDSSVTSASGWPQPRQNFCDPVTGWPQVGQAIATGGGATSCVSGVPHLRQNLAPRSFGARQAAHAMLIVIVLRLACVHPMSDFRAQAAGHC